MKCRSGSLRAFFTTPAGVASVLLTLLCALFTISRLPFEIYNDPQRSLKWPLGEESLPKPGKDTHQAWEAREGSSPHSKIAKNASVAETLKQPATESVEYLQNATSPVVVSEVSNDRGYVETASTLIEDNDDSIDWDPGWDSANLAPLEEAPGWIGRDDGSTEETKPAPMATIRWHYDVCLLVTTGRHLQLGRPHLPFSELYKLFNAAKGAPNGSEPWKTLSERKLYVGTDFADILCNMVRDDLGPSVECSNFNRFGVKTNRCKHVVVGDTKKFNAQPSRDELRRYSFVWDTIETVDLDTEDATRMPPPLAASEWRPTVVTGFSSNHVEVGLLLLRSLGKMASLQNDYNVSLVVWTMNEFPAVARRALLCVAEELQTIYKVSTEVRRFDFDPWPLWMRLNQKLGDEARTGEYAWKVIMIHTVLLERGFVYWADAGDRFRTVNSLTQTLHHVKMRGFASRFSAGYVKDWTHVKQLDYFGANRHAITSLPNCDASCIGFTLHRYTQLVRPWYECAITRQCIAPDGSSRKDHRQDQSALTVLAALSGDRCEGVGFGMERKMENLPNSHWIGVNATECYNDPLNLKWQ